jgi:acyl carrier protein
MDRERILAKVKNELEVLGSREIQDANEEIFRTGLLDSLNILNLITFIETEFNLRLDPFDVSLDSLGTLNKICDYILRKTKNC